MAKPVRTKFLHADTSWNMSLSKGGGLGTWPRLCLFFNSFLFAHQYFRFGKESAGRRFAGEQRPLVSVLHTCAEARPLLPPRTPRVLGGKAHLLFVGGGGGGGSDRTCAPSVTVLEGPQPLGTGQGCEEGGRGRCSVTQVLMKQDPVQADRTQAPKALCF